MTPIENQNPLGTCLSCAFAAFEYLLKDNSGKHIDVSKLFIYYNARKKTGKPIQDKGSNITYTLETLNEIGVCPESAWKYDIEKVNEQPSDEAYEAAKNNKITSALEVNQDLTEMKTCLAQGYPFVFSVRLFDHFFGTGKDGVVRMPAPTDKQATEHNRHAMVAVGYSDNTKEFIVRNSWGTNWGDEGYCYIPYTYMTDSELCFYRWVVQEMDTDMIEGDHRMEDDSTALHPDDEEDDHTEEFEYIDEGEADEEADGEQEEPQQEEQADPDNQ
ncbi:unnamed protein product [Rotaria sp. Silwood1]|nr:unnamed protein product [Rotaria sp. Silwood1]